MRYPFNVLIWVLPIMLILGYFAISSGSTLYFLITVILFFSSILIIYPFYSKANESIPETIEIDNIKSDIENLENWWNEAIKGKPVPQRLIEDRVYNMVIDELADRFDLSREETVRKVQSYSLKIDKKVLDVINKLLERRHNMEMRIEKDEFVNDLKIILDYIGGKYGF